MKFVKIVLVFGILAGICVGGFSYWIYNSLNTPHQHDKSTQYVSIEKGSPPAEIIAKLASEGILNSTLATQIYLRTLGDAGNLQAGEYQFPSPITPLQVLKELEKGEERTIKLTIPEGFTRFDIASRIAERFPQNQPVTDKQILLLMEDTALIKEIAPAAKNLEGYMYPSTYSFPRESNPADIIKTLVEQFKKTWRPEWTEQSKQIGRSPHEIVTIASLIETESKFDNERSIVASVIYNRLAKNIPLGIDQTAVYIAKMQNRWDGTIHKSDLESNSPYNTRRFGGIPPGPISSVTESSIAAALNPAQTDYIYYVLNVQANDGSHHFYSSARDFEKGKAEYQRWLERERQDKRSAESNQQMLNGNGLVSRNEHGRFFGLIFLGFALRLANLATSILLEEPKTGDSLGIYSIFDMKDMKSPIYSFIVFLICSILIWKFTLPRITASAFFLLLLAIFFDCWFLESQRMIGIAIANQREGGLIDYNPILPGGSSYDTITLFLVNVLLVWAIMIAIRLVLFQWHRKIAAEANIAE